MFSRGIQASMSPRRLMICELHQFIFDVSVTETFPTDAFINLLYNNNFIDPAELHDLNMLQDECVRKWRALNYAEKRLTELEHFAKLHNLFMIYGIGTQLQLQNFKTNLRIICLPDAQEATCP